MVRRKTGDAQTALDIIEHGPAVSLRCAGPDDAGRVLFATRNIEFFGYPHMDYMTGTRCWESLVHPEDADERQEKMLQAIAARVSSREITYRVINREACEVWVADVVTFAYGEDGGVLYTDHVISDYGRIAEEQERIHGSLRHQQVLNDILQALHSGEAAGAFQTILDRTGRHLRLSRAVLVQDDEHHTGGRVMAQWRAPGVAPLWRPGKRLDYAMDLPNTALTLQESDSRILDAGTFPPDDAEFAGQGVLAAAFFAVYSPGGERYGFLRFDECAAPRIWQAGTLGFLRGAARLITAAVLRAGQEESIRQMAQQDRLTGLPNRYGFERYMARAIRESQKAGKSGYVMFIDMDDFKVINDGYGHDYGDALLVAVANYLRQACGEFAEIFRFGGDEFTILLDHRYANRSQGLINDLLVRARHPWKVRDREFYCTVSVGVVRYPEGSGTATEVIRDADIALYQAKNGGKNNSVLYNRSMDHQTQHRAEMEHNMRDAISDGFCGFDVVYQPLVSVTGRVLGAEALLRWKDATGRSVPPDEFIPLAEYLGLIVPLGEFVLRDAAKVCRCANQVNPAFVVSVNVSIRQFQQTDFLQRVEHILLEEGVEMENLVLEVTEGLLVQDLDHMQLMMEELRGLGLRLAMDDFGTGYSSLNNMRRLPLDIIKIDGSFIRDVTTDAYAKSFIRMITDLGHSMGRRICAEGVETAAQYRYCAECGVDLIQGFYFHRPLPKVRLYKLLPGAESGAPH